jgi:cell division septation protein DedD
VSELTHDNVDDAFHEIQLSGKQLVFLFMATTVVSVFIFLCGVLVGRGVRAEDIGVDSTVATSGTPAPPTADAQPLTSPPAVVTEQPAAAADSALTYADRLSRDKPASEDLKARSTPPAEEKTKPETAAKPTIETPRSEPPPAAAPAATAAPAAAPNPAVRSGVWAVQVVSLRDRSAASKVVQRLTGKGYPAYLIAPAAGAPAQVYKVQVGRFDDRQEAQRISERLKKEEQFDPWIIR